MNPRRATTLGWLPAYCAKKGDTRQALELIERARAIDQNDVGLIYDAALVEALAGRDTEAIKTLRGALHKGFAPDQAENDPEFKSLSGAAGIPESVARVQPQIAVSRADLEPRQSPDRRSRAKCFPLVR